MADAEKTPLLENQPTPTQLEAQNPSTTLESFRVRVEEAQNSLREANAAYFNAWKATPAGKTFHRLNKCILGVAGIIGVGMITMMLFLLGYAIIYDDLPGEDYTPPRRVPLEAHIMSKCPDARDCLRDLVLPAMQDVSSYVDFKLSYIGTPTDSDDGVACMHGPKECLGNIIELCAAHLYPNPKIHLGFTMCMSKDYQEIPGSDMVRECALEHGISFDRLNECASKDDGAVGMDMLRDSVQRTAEANVTKSCTVRVDEQVWCVRDGGEWKECEQGHEVGNLVKEVMRLRNHRPETEGPEEMY